MRAVDPKRRQQALLQKNLTTAPQGFILYKAIFLEELFYVGLTIKTPAEQSYV